MGELGIIMHGHNLNLVTYYLHLVSSHKQERVVATCKLSFFICHLVCHGYLCSYRFDFKAVTIKGRRNVKVQEERHTEVERLSST